MKRIELSEARAVVDQSVRALGGPGRLPYKEYCRRRADSVISSVDFILTRGNRFLLIVRRRSSLDGKRWFFGGTHLRGKTVEDALYETVQAETKIRHHEILSVTPSHWQDIAITDQKKRGEGPAHMLMHIYLVEIPRGIEPKSDGTWSDPKWYTERSLSRYGLLSDLKLALVKAGLIRVER